MENKFKIVCLGSLILATEFFVLGEKEADVQVVKGGKKEFNITDRHMTFKDGVQVPKAGMEAHNNANNGAGFRDNIILEGRGSSRSEIKGQLSIKDNSVENLFIVDKNGVYVDGGSFSGADNVILSGKNKDGGPNGTVELVDVKRAKEDGIKADSKKLQIHVQDASVIGELNPAQSEAIFDNQKKFDGTRWRLRRDKKDSERGVQVSYHYDKNSTRKAYKPGRFWGWNSYKRQIDVPQMIRIVDPNTGKRIYYTNPKTQKKTLSYFPYYPKGTPNHLSGTKGYEAPFNNVALMPRPQPNPIGAGVPVRQLPVGDNLGQQQRDVFQPNVQSSPNSIPDYVPGHPRPVEGAVKKDGANTAGSEKQGTTENGTSITMPYYDENPSKHAESFEELVQWKQDRGDRELDNKRTIMKSSTSSVTTDTPYWDSFENNYEDTSRTGFGDMNKTEAIRSNIPGGTDLVDFSHLDNSFFLEKIPSETSSKVEGEGSAERLNLSSAQADELSAETSKNKDNRRRLREESNS